MPTVGKLVRNLAADGYFGKKDLQTTATAMLDGKGITKREKASFDKAVGAVLTDAEVRTTQETKDSFRDLKARMKNFSETKGVYAPTLDKDEIKNILARYTSPGRVSGGGESGYAVRASTGGE
jgi:hypothetical protein